MPKRTSGGASGSQGKKARVEPPRSGPRASLESAHHVLVQALLKERYMLEDEARKVGGWEERGGNGDGPVGGYEGAKATRRAGEEVSSSAADALSKEAASLPGPARAPFRARGASN